MASPKEVFRFIGRNSKRVAVTVVGAVLVVGGLLLLVLPGPGILVVVLGFAVLGTEYAWAAAALERTKKAADAAGRKTKQAAGAAGRKTKQGAQNLKRKVKGPKDPPRVQ